MPRTIRVLQVTPRFFPDLGGVETHVYEVARRLHGHDGLSVDVLTTDPVGAHPPEQTVAGVKISRVRAWPAGHDYYIAPEIARRLAGYDLIHCQGVHTFVPIVAMTAARRLKLPYLITPHTGGHSSWLRHRARVLQWRALAPLLREARRVICVAPFEARMFAKDAGVSRDRLVVVPNGTEAPPAIPRQRAEGPATVASVGRFVRYKGHHHLVAALPNVVDQLGDARLLLIGRGPYKQELRDQAKRLGVADKVKMVYVPPEERAAMTDLLSSVDVVALLSDYEAHPVAVMEAVALGRPVVVGRGSGLSDLVSDGFARAVHRPHDPIEVSRALCRELVDPVLPPTDAIPSWDDCARQTARAYREALAES